VVCRSGGSVLLGLGQRQFGIALGDASLLTGGLVTRADRRSYLVVQSCTELYISRVYRTYNQTLKLWYGVHTRSYVHSPHAIHPAPPTCVRWLLVFVTSPSWIQSLLIRPTMMWYHQVTGHPGSKWLYQHIHQRYCNRDLSRVVDNFNCDYCQRNKLDGRQRIWYYLGVLSILIITTLSHKLS
jgi:hypothetical protein